MPTLTEVRKATRPVDTTLTNYTLIVFYTSVLSLVDIGCEEQDCIIKHFPHMPSHNNFGFGLWFKPLYGLTSKKSQNHNLTCNVPQLFGSCGEKKIVLLDRNPTDVFNHHVRYVPNITTFFVSKKFLQLVNVVSTGRFTL